MGERISIHARDRIEQQYFKQFMLRKRIASL
jgi:hypothetical protein